MGRWDHRKSSAHVRCQSKLTELSGLFEGDMDWDLESDFQAEVQKRLEAKGIKFEEGDIYELFHNLDKPDFRPNPASITVKELQEHLNALSNELFAHYKANPCEFYGSYVSVVAGAVMMKAGAKIAEDYRNHLREVAGATPTSAGYQFPFFDMGFRGPGQVQFVAALDHYVEGKPRNFHTARYAPTPHTRSFNPWGIVH
jgi:hypothetical protein